jgi:N-acetylmuramoyl-L-alanine amidase
MSLDIEQVYSPNYSSRGDMDVTGVVIHYTADGPEWNPIKWLCMERAKASAHFVIERDGDVFRLVKLNKKAWHAGRSQWLYKGETRKDVSAYTIGIELANCGMLEKVNGKFFWQQGRALRPYVGPEPVRAALVYPDGHKIEAWWEPYANKQMDALQALLLKLSKIGYGDAAQNLVGHEEIGTPIGRKSDPGPLFPWDRFSRKTEKTTESVLM